MCSKKAVAKERSYIFTNFSVVKFAGRWPKFVILLLTLAHYANKLQCDSDNILRLIEGVPHYRRKCVFSLLKYLKKVIIITPMLCNEERIMGFKF